MWVFRTPTYSQEATDSLAAMLPGICCGNTEGKRAPDGACMAKLWAMLLQIGCCDRIYVSLLFNQNDSIVGRTSCDVGRMERERGMYNSF